MAIRYLILIVATRYNLDCRYCYNGGEAGAERRGRKQNHVPQHFRGDRLRRKGRR
jgi:molybdenum cofactor biosynthesis enzyme MoaA